MSEWKARLGDSSVGHALMPCRGLGGNRCRMENSGSRECPTASFRVSVSRSGLERINYPSRKPHFDALVPNCRSHVRAPSSENVSATSPALAATAKFWLLSCTINALRKLPGKNRASIPNSNFFNAVDVNFYLQFSIIPRALALTVTFFLCSGLLSTKATSPSYNRPFF